MVVRRPCLLCKVVAQWTETAFINNSDDAEVQNSLRVSCEVVSPPFYRERSRVQSCPHAAKFWPLMMMTMKQLVSYLVNVQEPGEQEHHRLASLKAYRQGLSCPLLWSPWALITLPTYSS